MFRSHTNLVTIWTTNAIYREYKHDVDFAKDMGCQVVNMDTSHLFASCKMLNMMYGYFATVSDLMTDESEWKNDLQPEYKKRGEYLINSF